MLARRRNSRPKQELLAVRVTDVWRDDAGVWRALLRFRGEDFACDREIGSWRITPAETDVGFHELDHSLAAELQAIIKKKERRRGNDPASHVGRGSGDAPPL